MKFKTDDPKIHSLLGLRKRKTEHNDVDQIGNEQADIIRFYSIWRWFLFIWRTVKKAMSVNLYISW